METEMTLKSLLPWFLSAACIFESNMLVASELPGTAQHKSFAVTAVAEKPAVSVRKVSFLRSNNIVLVGNLQDCTHMLWHKKDS